MGRPRPQNRLNTRRSRWLRHVARSTALIPGITCAPGHTAADCLSAKSFAPRSERLPHLGIMWVTFGHLRPSGHIMPDHVGDRGTALLVLAPHDHLHIKQKRAVRRQDEPGRKDLARPASPSGSPRHPRGQARSPSPSARPPAEPALRNRNLIREPHPHWANCSDRRYA